MNKSKEIKQSREENLKIFDEIWVNNPDVNEEELNDDVTKIIRKIRTKRNLDQST